MARAKTRRKTTRRTKQSASTAGWVWMFLGLAVGLSVAAAIYVNDRKPGQVQSVVKPAQPAKPRPAPKASAPEPDSRFDFYDMLPNFEVIIPEEDLEARPDVTPEPVASPGIYVLQAGSFSSYEDADRRKAQMALLGVVSRIQKVSVDDKTYHRVRVGPVNSLEELNALRERLRAAHIEIMVIRVGE
jgi:cell division protein FtsN